MFLTHEEDCGSGRKKATSGNLTQLQLTVRACATEVFAQHIMGWVQKALPFVRLKIITKSTVTFAPTSYYLYHSKNAKY